ncbi:MAG TPA: polymer-forming cytoskeletal protein [Gemmatimonadaceae bacterium]|nr:polymer-forming cytoskeletal protein [Gemmatimonadaceae bacterium]
MAIFKDQTVPRKDPSIGLQDLPPRKESDFSSENTPSFESTPRTRTREAKESVIAADLTIEGKIEGAGHVRMAGRFKGDVNVDGDLTIDPGAKITGSVRARTVTVGGELDGNIDAASRVELLSTGVLNGDLKAASLTVAAGSRMRGNVVFGWDDVPVAQPRLKTGTDGIS